LGSEEHIFSYTSHRTESSKLGSLFYETAGNGDTALLLIHGFPFDRRLWYKLVPLLKNVTLILPDMPGVGNSSIAGDTASMEDYAEAMIAVLDQQNISRCLVAGHSMGGYVALALADLYPERISGLSLVHSSSYADDDERKAKRDQVLNFIAENGAQAFTQAFVPGPFAPDYTNTPEIETLIKWADDCTAEGLTAAVKAMKNRPDRSYVLEQLNVPVQFIVGEKDPVFNYAIAFKQATYPKISKVHFMQNIGHMGMIESTEETARALNSFVTFCTERI
jgi:pimeloyl-ACP methyl ester carboxylesterase